MAGKLVGELEEAYRMLDAFASVGADRFDLTHINIDGEKRGFRPGQTLGQIRNSMSYLLDSAGKRQNNVIIRPHGGTNQIIQLDDLDAGKLERIRPFAFLTLQTSPGNHQAWVAVNHFVDSDKKVQPTVSPVEFARRLRKGADLTASGATRVAGTRNIKRKYEPDFPTVEILATFPGRIVNPGELEHLLAPPEEKRPTHLRPRAFASNRKWPRYEISLAGSPESKSRPGNPRESIADFRWCLVAAQWGWEVEDIAAKIIEISAKARENGQKYAEMTARNAAASLTEKEAHSR